MVENKEIRFEQDIETSLTTYGKWKKETFNESNFDPIIGLIVKIARLCPEDSTKTVGTSPTKL